MLLAPTLTERVILPAAWGGSYFFNRIGRLLPATAGSVGLSTTQQLDSK